MTQNQASSPADSKPATTASRVLALIPGILLCVAVAGVSALLERAELGVFEHPYVEALVMAILLGMDNLLSAYYGNKKVNAVLSPYDGLSIGIISSLKGVGYGSADQPMPIISGQDAEVPSIKAMTSRRGSRPASSSIAPR